MRITLPGLILLLTATVQLLHGSPAAADPINEALVAGLVQRGEGLIGKGGRDAIALAKRPMDGPRTAEVSKLLARIAELEARSERGDFAVSHAARARLARLRAELEQLPVALPAPAKTLQTVSGTVTRASDGAPLQNVFVSASDFSWGGPPVNGGGLVSSASTNAAGQYTLSLPPGAYLIRATAPASVSPAAPGGYRAQIYAGRTCDDAAACAIPFGTPVTVAASAVSGVDFALDRGGSIGGRVTLAGSGTAVAGTFVEAVGESDTQRFGTLTDAGGNYVLSGLPPGRFRVIAQAPSAAVPLPADEVYNDRPCFDSECNFIPADLLSVAAGTTHVGIDLALDVIGSLSGTVVDDLGNPVTAGNVTLYSADRYTVSTVPLDAGGNFVFPAVRPGTYRVFASGGTTDPVSAQFSATHIGAAWPDVACNAGCSPLDSGSPVVVGAGATTLPSPVVLQRGRSLVVTTRAAGTLTPVANAVISARASVGSGTCTTDAAGTCTIRGLAPGTHYVLADARGQNYVLTANGGAQCALSFCSQLGTPVTVAASGAPPAVTIDLATGGIITGTITDATTGLPATRLRTRIELFTAAGDIVAQQIQTCFGQPTATTPTTCSYTAAGLPPGSYKGVFVSSSTVGWIDTAFGGTPCPRGGCDLGPLPPLFATAGGTLAGINGTLARGALIRGRVTDAATAGPPDCRAFNPFDNSGSQCGNIGFNTTLDNYAGFAVPNRAGLYFSRTGFAPGTTVYASTFLLRNNFSFGWGYVDQAYNGIACPWGSCGITTGTGITVGAADVDGIDFALVRGGAIAGTVTASGSGTPIAAVEVRVYNAAGRQAGRAFTTESGRYLVGGLAPGSYRVLTSNSAGYLDEAWNDVPCEPFCNPLDGSAVSVAGTATTSGIDFALDLAASISGTVRLAGVGQSNVPVELYGAVGNLLRSLPTGAGGTYQFTGLAAGRYFVRTRDSAGRADALYSGLPCVGDACIVRNGTPIDLATGANLSGIDLALSAPATISGTVRRNPGSSPMSGVRVQLLAASGAVALTATTGASGAYAFTGLAPGSYRLVTRSTPGVVDVAWPGAPCPAACSGLNGSAITVTAGATVGGRDFLLDAGGSISGNVRSGPSAPIPGVTVQVYDTGGVPVGQIATNASGNYEIDTLPAGNFFARTQQSLGFVDQLFNGRPCSGYCDILSGDPIPVAAGSGTGLVDFVLDGGLSVSGRVRDASSGNGIALARVVAFDAGGFIAGQAQANAAGDYTIAGLRPGVYRLRTANLSGYVNQVHAGIACSPTPCSLAAGTPVTLVGAPVTGIDFNLVRGRTISGTAADTFNNPLPTGTAFLYDAAGALLGSTAVSNGLWEFNGLANGTYFVLVRNTLGLIDQLYDQVPCPAAACNITALGTPIVVSGPVAPLAATGGGTNAIDLRLPPGQTISGTVRDAGTSQPLAGVTVYFFNAAGVEVGQATTDGEGRYVSEGGLASGSYRAATANGVARGAGGGYVNQLWSGQNCLLACDFAAGTPIAVSGAPATGVDFNLVRAGDGISGRVRDTQNNPLALITIRVFTAAGVLAGTAQTNSQGFYRINGLPAGTYFARTANAFGFEDRLYGGAPCGPNCNPLAGTPIAVPATGEIGNIDFTLSLPDLMFRDGFEAPN